MAEETTPSPEQLCFAVHTSGTMMTKGGRLIWATRHVWESMDKHVMQVIPIVGEPPIGSVPLMDNGTPDVVGRMIKLLSLLEAGANMLAKRVATIDQQLAGRVHERELLRRAAAMIDPDSGPTGFTTEARLDWLAKYREVVT